MNQYYNLLAKIIKKILNEQKELEHIRALSNNEEDFLRQEDGKLVIDEIISDVQGMEKRLESDGVTLEQLIFWEQIVEKLAYKEWMQELERQYFDLEEFVEISGLNSSDNQQETGVLLLPRFECIWEGESRQKNHITDVNTFLNYSYAVVLENGKIDSKYQVINYIMDSSLYGINLDRENELFVSLGLSPILESVILKTNKYQRNVNGRCINFFSVEKHNEDTEKVILDLVQRIIKKADSLDNDVVIFPEMLGTRNIVDEVREILQNNPLRKTKFIVLPSVWKADGEGINKNYSVVMNYCGEIICEQDKLKRFPWQNKVNGQEYIEDIIEGDIMHIMHIRGYGSVAILICRSELDERVRDILIKQLNVKLLLCPSWTEGASHEFETSIMAGAERECNAVWCNTCSALKNKEDENKVIGIVSGYGKNKNMSQLDFEGRRFPLKSGTSKVDGSEAGKVCRHECNMGCLFFEKIYGVDCELEGVDECDEE